MIQKYRAWDVLSEKMIDEILMISFVRKEIIGKFSDGSTSVPLKFEDKRNGEDVTLMQSTGLKDKNGILKYYQRFSYKTLARILGRSEKAIRDRIRKLGKRKILDLTIFHKDVVSLANQGIAVKDIAQKLGLHYNQVYYYLNKHQIPYKKREFRNQSNNLAWSNLNDMIFMRRT